MARSFESQTRHDAEVSKLYRSFTSNTDSSQVRADLAGQAKPDLVDGHVPDVAGVFKSRPWYVEVETGDTYASEHSLSQYRAFLRAGGLVISVPAKVESELKSFIATNGVTATVFTY